MNINTTKRVRNKLTDPQIAEDKEILLDECCFCLSFSGRLRRPCVACRTFTLHELFCTLLQVLAGRPLSGWLLLPQR